MALFPQIRKTMKNRMPGTGGIASGSDTPWKWYGGGSDTSWKWKWYGGGSLPGVDSL
jgi:hypothetical protein